MLSAPARQVGAGDTPTELIRALAHLAEPPGPAHPELARALDLPGEPDPVAYADVLLFQLHPYASVQLGPEGMLGGEARGRIAGFWQAVGRTPPTEPDHLASLTGLYASLAEEEAERSGPEARLVRRSRRALLEEHLAPWVFPFLARVGELTGGPYGAWAGLLYATLAAELDREGPCRVRSVHLVGAPVLPDPRQKGAAAFLEGLLAPVRSGMILTRADLALLASGLDLGLRAGERRYALENLLGQDPPAVLRRLAAEAARQARGHDARVDRIGDPAVFLAERAYACARLLEELAEAEPEPTAAGWRSTPVDADSRDAGAADAAGDDAGAGGAHDLDAGTRGSSGS